MTALAGQPYWKESEIKVFSLSSAASRDRFVEIAGRDDTEL